MRQEVLTVGGLFSGIGGWELGLERAGMRVLWHCEQDEFCRRVLARHWPGVPCHPDVRALVADAQLGGRRGEVNGGQAGRPDSAGSSSGAGGSGDGDSGRLVSVPVPYVDVLCGGFPCQDISVAGTGAGIGGSRSGLWGEFARLIGELRPRYVLVENVAALTSRGLDSVLGDLAARGFDAEWDCLPASAFGAPHRRDRLWLVAYPRGVGNADGAPSDAHAAQGASRPPVGERGGDGRGQGGGLAESRMGVLADGLSTGLGGHWDREPDIPRVAVGVSQRVDKLRALGNALVPQVSEWIGRRIIEWEGMTECA